MRPQIGFNLDIVGGAVGSLCEAYREVTRCDHHMHRVNLLFDHDTEAVIVESPYTHDRLGVTLKTRGPLLVRLPPWVDRGEVSIAGASSPVRWTDSHLFVGRQAAGVPLRICFPLKEREITLGTPQPRPIRARLRGDAVVAMERHGASLTYFPGLNE